MMNIVVNDFTFISVRDTNEVRKLTFRNEGKPVFPNDCEDCLFLGHIERRQTDPLMDVYACGKTILIRWGAQASAYWSMELKDKTELWRAASSSDMLARIASRIALEYFFTLNEVSSCLSTY